MGIVVLRGTTLKNNLHKTKALIKTMKRLWYERHDKGNKNNHSYEITDLNKIYHEI